MFKQGDQVVYGIHGVCRILCLETRIVDRKKVEYYVLEPLEQPGTRYFVPTQNPAAVAKMRPILTKCELDALLLAEEPTHDMWISDDNRRKQCYQELISSGNRAALIHMVRILHKHKTMQISSGKKFHLCDENFLRDAEKLLSSEFSLVLGIKPEAVGQYILDKIGNNSIKKVQ